MYGLVFLKRAKTSLPDYLTDFVNNLPKDSQKSLATSFSLVILPTTRFFISNAIFPANFQKPLLYNM